MFIFILSLFSCLVGTTIPTHAEVTIDYSEVEINGEFHTLETKNFFNFFLTNFNQSVTLFTLERQTLTNIKQ